MNQHGTPIGCAPNQVSGSSSMASGSKGKRGHGCSVGTPTSVASPKTARVFRLPFWLGSPAGRELALVRVVAPNNRTENNGLERTRRVGVPAARAIIRVSPCRSTRCSAGLSLEGACR